MMSSHAFVHAIIVTKYIDAKMLRDRTVELCICWIMCRMITITITWFR